MRQESGAQEEILLTARRQRLRVQAPNGVPGKLASAGAVTTLFATGTCELQMVTHLMQTVNFQTHRGG